MKSKAMPHLILAVILALVAGFLTIRWLGSMRGTSEAPKPKVEVKKVEVVVAARAIPKGARLDGTMVRLKAFEADVAPASAERVLAEVEGRVTARDISQDDPITPDKLLPRGVTPAGLANAVDPGKRAVTVKGSKMLGSGGLITPGSRVDVVGTFQVPGKSDAKVGKMIMQDIPVLATGTELETRIGKDGKEELANTELYTLLVTPSQAEELVLAADHGALHFAVRHTGDEQAQTTTGADLGVLAGVAVGSEKPAGPPSAPDYAYQAVRASSPRAVAQGGGGQGAPGASQAGGAQPAQAGGAGGAAKGPSHAEAGGPGVKELSQGSEQIKVHDVIIECATCPPRH